MNHLGFKRTFEVQFFLCGTRETGSFEIINGNWIGRYRSREVCLQTEQRLL